MLAGGTVTKGHNGVIEEGLQAKNKVLLKGTDN